MKKLLVTLLALISALTLPLVFAACGDDRPDNQQPEDEPDTEITLTGEWNIYKLTLFDKDGNTVYIAGEDYPEFEDMGGFETSYKIIFYEDGTVDYTEEWVTVTGCSWTQNGNDVEITDIGDNNGRITLTFDGDTLTHVNEYGELIFKK